MTHATDSAKAGAPNDRRCGTCRRWTPHEKRDGMFDRHFGDCSLPHPKLAACFSAVERWSPSSIAGDDCPRWLKGGKHGDLE